jgi:hypothetical protein
VATAAATITTTTTTTTTITTTTTTTTINHTIVVVATAAVLHVKSNGLAPCPMKSPGLFANHFIPKKRCASTHWTGTQSVYQVSKEKNKYSSTLG